MDLPDVSVPASVGDTPFVRFDDAMRADLTRRD